MTTTNPQMVTRCPQCATAFRITPAQLQSAKGAVRCGSCLHVFKASEHILGELKPTSATAASEVHKAVSAEPATPITPEPTSASAPEPNTVSQATPESSDNNPNNQQATPIDPDDDLLISDDMDDGESEDDNKYEFDSYLDVDVHKPNSSLFDREARTTIADDAKESADESWAEELIEDEEETPQLRTIKPAPEPLKTTGQHPTKTPPGLMFSLIGDHEGNSEDNSEDNSDGSAKGNANSEDEANLEIHTEAANNIHTEHEDRSTSPIHADDDFVLSDELANAPNYTGFGHSKKDTPPPSDPLDTSLFESPDDEVTDDEVTNDNVTNKARQAKTEPKIRAYDNSRSALLMNIIPAPIEFTSKRMRRWYQKRLWPTLSLLALSVLIVQLAWFKFDYFSRVEPYRTGYVLLCPLLGCQVPTLVDRRQVSVFNLVVRAHPDTENALLVDAIILNKAPFEQPFTDLVLAFTDLDEKPIASRQFTPKEYLGGELAGKQYMPRNQPIHITLELIDPGTQAVNYHAYIPH